MISTVSKGKPHREDSHISTQQRAPTNSYEIDNQIKNGHVLEDFHKKVNPNGQ